MEYLLFICAIVSVKCQLDSITVRDRFIFVEIGRPCLVEEEVTLHQPYQLKNLKEMLREAKEQQEGLNETCEQLEPGLEEDKLVENIDEIGGLDITEIARFYHPYTHNPRYKNDTLLYGLADAKRICDENGFTLVQPKTQHELFALIKLIQAFDIPSAVINVKFDSHRSLNRLEDYSEAVMIPSELYPLTYAVSSVGTNPDHMVEDNNAVYLALPNGTLYIGREFHSGPADASWSQNLQYRNPKITKKMLMIPQVKGGVVCQLKHKKQYRDVHSQLKAQKEQVRRAKTHCAQLALEMKENVQHLDQHLEQTITKYGIEYFPEGEQRHKRSWGALLRMPRLFRSGKKALSMARNARTGYQVVKAGRHLSKGIDIDIPVPVALPNVLQQAENLAETVGQVLKVGKAIYAPLKPIAVGLRKTVLDKSPIRNGLLEQVVLAIQRVNSDFNVNALITQALSNFQQISRSIYEGIEELDDTIQSLVQKQIPGKFLKGIKNFFTQTGEEKTVAQLRDLDPIIVEPEVDSNDDLHVLLTFQQGTEKWKMFQVIPTPIFDNHMQEFVTTSTKYALINMEGSKYIVLTEEEMDLCRDGLCKHSSAIQSVRNDECVLAHYRQEMILAEKCEVSISPAQSFFHAIDEGILYALPGNLTVSISCPEQPELSQIQFLTGKGILYIPPGCELLHEDPYMLIPGPIENTFESLGQEKNHTHWKNLKAKYERVRFNQTKITRLQLSQAKATLSSDIKKTVLILTIIAICFFLVSLALCAKLVFQNTRINRRKRREQGQESAYVELRTDFDRFSDRMIKLVQAMEKEKKKKERKKGYVPTAPPVYGQVKPSEESDGYVEIQDPGFDDTPEVDEIMRLLVIPPQGGNCTLPNRENDTTQEEDKQSLPVQAKVKKSKKKKVKAYKLHTWVPAKRTGHISPL